jgi:hypothetical protein
MLYAYKSIIFLPRLENNNIMVNKKMLAIVLTILCTGSIFAQNLMNPDTKEAEKKSHWYDKISLRGYSQIRYNRLLETNPDLKCEQCDRSWGDNGGFFVRRARMIFSGDISDRLYIYIQPDLANTISASNATHYVQLRDLYFDLALNKSKSHRLRFGQSKVAYGFENMQSSQNRLPLDRADGTNSAVPNERDLGISYYWAPAKTRELYKKLIADGLKGSGDYGVFGFGVYNGQVANGIEANDNLHKVARLSYPIEIGNQIIEPGIQGYTGKYTLATTQLSTGVKYVKDLTYTEQRAAASINLYPKPFGILAEYNIGKGPGYNVATDSIEQRKLEGGFVTASYLIKKKGQSIIPYARYQYFKGGKKQETDARWYNVNELETGIEWSPVKAFELTAAYVISERSFIDHKKPSNLQKGNLVRIQTQFNF